MNLEDKLKFAVQLAHEAGEIMHKYYRADERTVSVKDVTSVVTIADTEINRLIIERVKEVFPEHGVLGEEESHESHKKDLWVCDPIDGTRDYISHVPLSMFSLAYVKDGEPLVGVAFNPWTNDLYHARKGGGAFRNEDRIRVAAGPAGSSGKNIIGSSFFTGGHHDWKRPEKMNFVVHPSYGIVFKCCMVAEGSFNGQVFEYTTAHDVAATTVIVREAGGKVTDLDGNDQRYDGPVNGCIVSDGLVHEELVRLVRESRPR